MNIYADTSWWLAYKSRRDANHDAAITLFDLHSDARVIWTPWHRVEVFNTIRQVERSGAIAVGDARNLIRLLEQEIRLGYWPHREFDWRDAVRTASELSAEHGLSISIRAMDLFHVAIAIELGADALLTFDREQQALAAEAGLRVLHLPTRRSR